MDHESEDDPSVEEPLMGCVLARGEEFVVLDVGFEETRTLSVAQLPPGFSELAPGDWFEGRVRYHLPPGGEGEELIEWISWRRRQPLFMGPEVWDAFQGADDTRDD